MVPSCADRRLACGWNCRALERQTPVRIGWPRSADMEAIFVSGGDVARSSTAILKPYEAQEIAEILVRVLYHSRTPKRGAPLLGN